MNINVPRLSVLLFVALPVLIPTVVQGQTDYRYAVFPQPTLGGQHSYCWTVNELGEVAGSASIPVSGFHGTIWKEAGQPLDVGTFGGKYSDSKGINSSGEVVGWSTYVGEGSFDSHPFLWDNEQMTDLGTLGGDYGEANAINELGEVVGFTETIPGQRGSWRAFIWADGVMTALPELDTPGSVAWGLNDTGLIVGQSWSGEFGNWRAVLWKDGNVSDLGTLRPDGRGRSVAHDVNDQEIVVGQAEFNPQGRDHAFVCRDGQMYDLGTVSGRLNSGAFAINNLNQIVGWATNGYPDGVAFIWEQSRGIQQLDALVAPNARWRLTDAWDINDSEQIVGNGYRLGDAGTSVGYLLSPVRPTLEMAAPSPGTAGTSNTITLTNVTPGATVHFLYSRQGGGTRIPGCDLQLNALQLDNPTIIGSAIADANGNASITRNVPLIARGQTILFQAVVQNECAISQLVVHQFE